jgi:hypothetical protein
MIAQFQWYRRWRGGRWVKVCGLFFGSVWVRVGPECLERVDEDYSENRELPQPEVE